MSSKRGALSLLGSFLLFGDCEVCSSEADWRCMEVWAVGVGRVRVGVEVWLHVYGVTLTSL